MKVNIYFVIVGVLTVLFAITHAWNGQVGVLAQTESSALELSTKTTLFYVWHILSIENLLYGAAFLYLAFSKRSAHFAPAAWLIAMVIVARWLVIEGVTAVKDFGGLAGTAYDSLAILVLVALIILGIRRSNRILRSSNNS